MRSRTTQSANCEFCGAAILHSAAIAGGGSRAWWLLAFIALIAVSGLSGGLYFATQGHLVTAHIPIQTGPTAPISSPPMAIDRDSETPSASQNQNLQTKRVEPETVPTAVHVKAIAMGFTNGPFDEAVKPLIPKVKLCFEKWIRQFSQESGSESSLVFTVKFDRQKMGRITAVTFGVPSDDRTPLELPFGTSVCMNQFVSHLVFEDTENQFGKENNFTFVSEIETPLWPSTGPQWFSLNIDTPFSKAVLPLMPRIRACYAMWIQGQPKKTGGQSLQFIVVFKDSQTGAISEVNMLIDNQTLAVPKDVSSCLKKTVADIRYRDNADRFDETTEEPFEIPALFWE
jgi:hypothetical protein